MQPKEVSDVDMAFGGKISKLEGGRTTGRGHMILNHFAEGGTP